MVGVFFLHPPIHLYIKSLPTLLPTQSDPTDKFYFNVDTPGSGIDRRISLLFEVKRTSPSILLHLETPWKELKIHAGYSMEEAVIAVHAGGVWLVWCGVVWCGVVWCGVVWCGVVWCGVVWCGVVWCGVVWCGAVWCGVVWCGVVWCGVVWCGVVWCGVVWCGVV